MTKVSNINNLTQLAGKRIAETLEVLEHSGMSRKEIDIIRKGMWRLSDEIILTKKVSENEQSNQGK